MMRSREQRIRLQGEYELLRQHGLVFSWEEAEAGTALTGTLRTQSGKRYLVRLSLPDEYPLSPPAAYLLSPVPPPGQGRSLQHASATMHTLRPDREGHPQICHSHPSRWNSSVDNLVKVLGKVKVWLEALELSIATGQPIDRYLSHAR
jgi:hypothetical protein